MEIQLRKNKRGTFNFDKGIISVTDPSYEKGIWCRLDNVKIKPGVYECNSFVCVNSKDKWDKGRTFIAQICLEGFEKPENDKGTKIGSIGVDAGEAGFYQDKPDYNSEEWMSFCERITKNNYQYLISEHGFCTSSGYGDGYYDVYSFSNSDGEICCLEIHF